MIRKKKLHRKNERIYLGKFIKKVKVKNWQMEMLMMMMTNTNTPRPNPDTCLVRLDGQILFESWKKNLQIQKYPDTCGVGKKSQITTLL